MLKASSNIPLSSLSRDPVLRRFFDRGEQDPFADCADLRPPASPLPGGAMVELRRNRIEDAIEYLVDLLDSVDPDPDLEPSLGGISACGKGSGPLAALDCEDECEDEGAQCDDEGAEPDSGIADLDGLLEQRPFTTGMSEFAGAL
jgi:hypothetical protein